VVIRLRRILHSMQDTIRQDWGLILVALIAASIIWREVDENRNLTRYFPDVEVKFVGLDPALRLASQKEPKVGVRVTGPRILDDLDGADFIMRADLADIKDATTYEVVLTPKGFSPIVPGLTSEDIRVRQVGITPSRIEIKTEWNSWVARVVPRYSPKPALGYVISATYVTPATVTLAGSDADMERHRILRNKNELVLDGQTETKEQVWTLEDMNTGNLKVLDEPKPVIRFKVFIEPFFRKRQISQVPIQVSGLVAGTSNTAGSYNVEPTNVDVLLQGARLKVNSLAVDSLALDLDISKLPPGEHEIPTVHLVPINLPADVQIIEATPAKVSVWVQGPHELETVFQDIWKGVRDSYFSGNTPLSVTRALSITPLQPILTPMMTPMMTPMPAPQEENH
jgi:YbbR domain-containing protein